MLRWIQSYLTDRMQAVRDQFENITSPLINTRVGVPQGSVLGPLLFILYISNLHKTLKHCKYNLYADDLQIYSHCEPRHLSDGILRVNEDIESIVQWSTQNGLLLNSEKTQAILIGTARYINGVKPEEHPSIKVQNAVIPFSDNVKYLGVYISKTLTWDKQVTSTVGKIQSKLYQLKITKRLLPHVLRVRLVSALIFPQLDYCCAAFIDITEQQNMRLHRALNACVRFIYNLRKDEHITPFYRELWWLKVNLNLLKCSSQGYTNTY